MSDQVAPNSAPQGTDPMAMSYSAPVQTFYGEYPPTFGYSGMYSPYSMPYAYTYPPAYPDQMLMDKLLKQIEYYFSENNLSSDGYLISQMDSEFLVPIDVIANFNRVRYLTQNILFVVQAMKSSGNLIVQEEIMKVGPIIKFPRKTLVIRSSPVFEKEEIERLFATESIPGSALRCELKDIWFVEFENDDYVLQAHDVILKQQSEARRVTAFVKPENVSVPTPIRRDMMPGNPVPPAKGYGGVPNVYASPAFPYYGMMPGWRPPQIPGYGYPPQGFDVYGAHLRPPTKPFQNQRHYKGGKGRREHHRIDGEINSSILQNPDEHGRRELVDHSSHVLSGINQHTGEIQEHEKQEYVPQSGSPSTQYQSPPQEDTPLSPPTAVDSVPQATASVAEPAHGSESDAQAASNAEQIVSVVKELPVAAEGNVIHDSGSRGNKHKKKGKGGRFEGQSFGEQRHRHGQDVLQPADFPPLSTNPATKAVGDVPAGSYRQLYQPRNEQGYFSHKSESNTEGSGQPQSHRADLGRGPRYNTRPNWQDSGRNRDRPEGKPTGAQGEQRRPRNAEQGENRRGYRKDGDRQSQRPHRGQGEPIEMHISLRTTTEPQSESQQSTLQSTNTAVTTQQTISPKASSHVIKAESASERVATSAPTSLPQSNPSSSSNQNSTTSANVNPNATLNPPNSNSNTGGKQEKGADHSQSENYVAATGGKKSYAAVAAKPSSPATPAVSSAQ